MPDPILIGPAPINARLLSQAKETEIITIINPNKMKSREIGMNAMQTVPMIYPEPIPPKFKPVGHRKPRQSRRAKSQRSRSNRRKR